MNLSIVILLIFVVLPSPGNTSLDYNVKSSGPHNKGNKKSLLVLTPVENVHEIDGSENNRDAGFNDVLPRTRKPRCQDPKILKELRRSLIAKHASKYISASRSNSAKGSVQTSGKSRKPIKPLTKDTRNLPHSGRKSRIIKREDDDAPNERIVLQPDAQDMVILYTNKPNMTSDNAPKKYVCQCVDREKETTEDLEKFSTTNITKKKRRSKTSTTRSINDENNEIESDLLESKRIEKPTELTEKSLSPETLAKESTSSKRLCRAPIGSPRLQHPIPKTMDPSMTVPHLSKPITPSHAIKFNVPLEDNRDPDGHVPSSKWPFAKIIRSAMQQTKAHRKGSREQTSESLRSSRKMYNHVNDEQADYDSGKQFGVRQLSLYPTTYMPFYITPRHDQPHPQFSLYDESLTANQNVAKPSPRDQPVVAAQELPCMGYLARLLGKTYVNIGQCIKLYGVDHCSPRESGALMLGSRWQKGPHNTNPGMPQSVSAKWKHFANAGNGKERPRHDQSSEVISNEEQALQRDLQHSQDQIYELQPISAFRFVSRDRPTPPFIPDPYWQTPNIASRGFVGAKQDGNKEIYFDENNNDNDTPSAVYSSSIEGSGETQNYSDDYEDASQQSEENDYGENLFEKKTPEFPQHFDHRVTSSFQAAHGAKANHYEYIPRKPTAGDVFDTLRKGSSGRKVLNKSLASQEQQHALLGNTAELEENRDNSYSYENNFGLSDVKELMSDEIMTENDDELRKEEKTRLKSSYSHSDEKEYSSGRSNDKNEYEDEDYVLPDATAIFRRLLNKLSKGFKSAKFNSPTDQSKTPRTDQVSAILKEPFGIPKIPNSVLNDLKSTMSNYGDMNELYLATPRMKDNEIKTVFENIINQLLARITPRLLSASALGTDYRSEYSDSGDDYQSDETSSSRQLVNYIEMILQYFGIDVDELQSPIIQDILSRTVQNFLSYPERDLEKPLMFDSLKIRLPHPELTVSSAEKPSRDQYQSSESREEYRDSGSKNLPIIPVKEHIFKNGHWMEKDTFVGSNRKSFDSEISSESLAAKSRGYSGEEFAKAQIVGKTNILPDAVTDGINESVDNEEGVENMPTKYYSKAGTLFSYRKKIQNHEAQSRENLPKEHGFEEVTAKVRKISNYSNIPTEAILENSVGAARSRDNGPRNHEPPNNQVGATRSRHNGPSDQEAPNNQVGATRSRHNGPSDQEAPNNQVVLWHEGIADDDASLSSIEQSDDEAYDHDPTYLGKVTVSSANSDVEKLSDLGNKELFYVGDGVKIPLTMTKVNDGSWALSISARICENFIKRKCPCCVPNEGDIIEEEIRSEEDFGGGMNIDSSGENNYSGQLDQIEGSISNHEQKSRHARSFPGKEVVATRTPVIQFAKKYNLTLDLTNLPNDTVKSWRKMMNPANQGENMPETDQTGSSKVIQTSKLLDDYNRVRSEDEEENEDQTIENHHAKESPKNIMTQDELSFDNRKGEILESHMEITNFPESNGAGILMTAVDGLINSPSVKNLGQMLADNGVVTLATENSRQSPNLRNKNEDLDSTAILNEHLSSGYQQKNPILEKIKWIKQKQIEQAPYRYQRNIDHEAKERMHAMTTVLHWLKKVFLKSVANNDT